MHEDIIQAAKRMRRVNRLDDSEKQVSMCPGKLDKTDKQSTYLDSRLYDKSIDDKSGKAESPANTVLLLNNSLFDRFNDVRLGNRASGGIRGTLFDLLLLLMPRSPAVSPMAQLYSLSFDIDLYSNGVADNIGCCLVSSFDCCSVAASTFFSMFSSIRLKFLGILSS